MSAPTDAELRELLDRQAIRDCVHRYARGLDRHDDEMIASAYHEGALDRHGDFLGSVAEFIPWANALHAAEWVAHHHHLTTHNVELDGDTAHAETYCIGTFLRKDGSAVDMAGGRYIDRLERRDGEWKIAAREVVIEWACAADARSSRFSTDPFPDGTWDTTDLSYRRPLTVDPDA
jgi:ketosteroid isomerase-like protein